MSPNNGNLFAPGGVDPDDLARFYVRAISATIAILLTIAIFGNF